MNFLYNFFRFLNELRGQCGVQMDVIRLIKTMQQFCIPHIYMHHAGYITKMKKLASNKTDIVNNNE